MMTTAATPTSSPITLPILTNRSFSLDRPCPADIDSTREVRDIIGVIGVRSVAVLENRERDAVARQTGRAVLVSEAVVLLLLAARALEPAPAVVVTAPVDRSWVQGFLEKKKSTNTTKGTLW